MAEVGIELIRGKTEEAGEDLRDNTIN